MENYIAKEIKNIIDRQNPWDTPQMLQKEIESFLRNQKINFKCVKALGNVKKAKIFCLFFRTREYHDRKRWKYKRVGNGG